MTAPRAHHHERFDGGHGAYAPLPPYEILSTQFAQRGLDHLALLGRQRRLRRDGITDRVTLNVEACLDAGGQVEPCKGLVDAPQPALQRHRLVPARRLAEVIEFDALPRNDAGGPAIQPSPPISITAAGIWADAENTLMLSPQRFMIDSSRPVLVEASLM